jgi:hypothetical protein
MNWKDFVGSGSGLIGVLHLPNGPKETTKISVRITSVPAEIRTDRLPDSDLEFTSTQIWSAGTFSLSPKIIQFEFI